MGIQRIGLRGERGRCLLDTVESLPASDEEPSHTIYTATDEMLTDDGLLLGLNDVIQTTPHITDELELDFLTPTSIKVDGRWTSTLTFEILIRNLLRRIRFLSICHCGEDLDVDTSALMDEARTVKHISGLQWLPRGRYSYRKEALIPMSGFRGKIRFEGNIEPFLPFICLGKHLHIGHHTAFGYGQYRITTPSSDSVGAIS